MNKPTITTAILVILMFIIGLYVIGEVNYYSAKSIKEKNIDCPVVTIPSIGVNEKVNNISISNGVYHENKSFTPINGEVILYGHRTLQGSPFLRLNELNKGDTITLNWPNIGEVNYTVVNKTVVPENTELKYTNEDNNILLITCDPIGSTANRLIIEGNLTSVEELNNQIIKENPNQYNSIIIIVVFLISGLIISYFYWKDNRIYLTVTLMIITAILIYFYFFPIPSEIIYSRIIG